MTLLLHSDPSRALLFDVGSFYFAFLPIEERGRLHVLTYDLRILDTHAELVHLIMSESGKGYGTAFMRELCDWADKEGFTLEVTPADGYPGTDMARLLKFYERFGFIPNEGKDRLEGCYQEYYRPVKGKKQ